MATRALLRFVGSRGVSRRAHVYKHTDGAPSQLLPGLRDLQRTLTATATDRGAGYAAAQFIYLDKRRSGAWPAPLLGHAVVETDTTVDDIEYRYRIRVGQEWRVAVSEHRGFDPSTPFERTEWQFAGPLSAATATFSRER